MTDSDNEAKQHLQEMSDFYAENSNIAMSLCNETTRNLNGLLMTASLAYIGVVTALMDVDMLKALSCAIKVFIVLGLMCFGISIVFGILEAVVAVKTFRNATPKYMEISNLLAKAVYSTKEREKANLKIEELSKTTAKEYGRIWLYLQIGSFGVGAIFTFLYIIGIIL